MPRARLILARHGNTFAPDDKPVWVGARSDLPLVDKGLAQARSVAAALRRYAIIPDAILSGPLQRTLVTACIVAETLGLAPNSIRIDPRLTEIDYGTWEGKSSEDIIAMGGAAELAAWNDKAVFPTTPRWQPAEARLVADAQSLLAEATSGTSLIVTSNGILRFFARAAVNAASFPDRKVATGHICVMEARDQGDWYITAWNQPPDLLSL